MSKPKGFHNQCPKCRHEWDAKVPNPKRCPKCNARMFRSSVRTTPSKIIIEYAKGYLDSRKNEYVDESELYMALYKKFPDVPSLRLEKCMRRAYLDWIVERDKLSEKAHSIECIEVY